MTPQERAKKVVEDLRDHKMFNVDTDGTWERYITSAIKCALEDSLPDARSLDEVVHELGIEDSHVTPSEAVRNLQEELTTWQNVAQRAGICMSCALGAPEPFGCTDCLNTGWTGGTPAGFTLELPREPGTCKCGAAPINKDGMCATCVDERPAPVPQWRAFHAMAWPKLWGIETTDPRAVEAGLEILVAPCMPEHAAKALSNTYNFAACMQNTKLGKQIDRETTQILLDLLNPLHGRIDLQTYDERYKQGFDASADTEYNVDITARMERDLTQAVLILEARQRSSLSPLSQTEEPALAGDTASEGAERGMIWFELKGAERRIRCATENCWGRPVAQLEAGGIVSNYCSGCRARMEALAGDTASPQAQEQPDTEGGADAS